jgi:hypothetical protein
VVQLFSWSGFTELVHLISHRASWPKRSRHSLVFRVCFVRISTVTPTNLIEVYDFTQPFQAHDTIVP